MKKLLALAIAAILCPSVNLLAQRIEDDWAFGGAARSKTEATFNITGIEANIHAIVQLHNGKMILDMQNVGDYSSFRNIDSLLKKFSADIAFYKDSLETNNGGHVRIDYAVSPEYSFKKIRFKKYPADGDIFVDRSGEVSRLKIEQDTIHILIEKLLYKSACTLPYSISLTLLVDSYNDVSNAFADAADTNKIIDTLEKMSHSRKTDKPNSYPQFTIFYNPYTSIGKRNPVKLNGVRPLEDKRLSFVHDHDYIQFNASFGSAVVMNTLSPTVEMGLSLNSPKRRTNKDFSFMKLYASTYHFFERKAEGGYTVRNNWFINFAAGNYFEKGDHNWPGFVSDFGGGYLFAQQGNYFKGTTMRVFTDFRVTKAITITPEIIATGNLKQFFPGISIKVL